jgi:hypothetical protein
MIDDFKDHFALPNQATLLDMTIVAIKLTLYSVEEREVKSRTNRLSFAKRIEVVVILLLPHAFDIFLA